MLSGFLALLATVSPLQQGPTMHYRITLKASRNIDRTANGEEALSGAYTAVAFVTATTTMESGGRVGHVVIDSVSCKGTGVMAEAYDTIVGRRSRGARYDFPIGLRLEVIPVPTITNTLTNTLAQTALMLFPNVSAGATVGTTWFDSLDTSPMTDPSARNRPIITRWRVTSAVADSTVAEGDVRGTLSSMGRMTSTGLIAGSRHLTVVSGELRLQTSTTNTQTLMAPEGATAITVGTATTTLEIIAIP
jgi:hypothetical protein